MGALNEEVGGIEAGIEVAAVSIHMNVGWYLFTNERFDAYTRQIGDYPGGEGTGLGA